MATIEQGLKVFTAIYKRIYRSLSQEYLKLFNLNKLHINEKIYFTINEPEGPSSQEVSKQDYSDELLVKPNADPNIVSSSQKLMKVQSYGSLLQLGTIQPLEYTKRFLEASEVENISALINKQPPPNPEAQKMQAEMQMKQQDAQQKAQVAQMTAAIDQKSKEMDMKIKAFEAQMKEREMQMQMMHDAKMNQMEMAHNLQSKTIELHLKEAEANQKLSHKEAEHEMKLKQAQEKPSAGTSK